MYRRVGKTLLKGWPITIALVFVGSVAVASIPDAQGVIHGCYLTSGGRLRVIDSDKGQHCKATETPLNWNQTGPQGLPGPAATVAEFNNYGIACPTSTAFFPNDRCELNPADGSLNVNAVYIDPSNYPGSATYHIEWVLEANNVNEQVCARLYDYTAGAPVTGTTGCWTRTGVQQWSNPIPTPNFPLSAGLHEYAAQLSVNPVDSGNTCCSDGSFNLIIDW